MKTSEFISKVESLQYDVSAVEGFIYIKTYFGTTCARAYTKGGRVILDTDNMNLAKLVIEYAETPINEREEEKKYIVIIPDPESEGSRFALARTVNGKIVINIAKMSSIESLKRYHLTEAEIKRNHKYLWQFAKEVQE